MVKPRNLAGSVGVTLVEDPAGLEPAIAAVHAAGFAGVPQCPEVLVEEYLSGPEISVDSLVRAGAPAPVVIAHKRQDLKPTFEETGHLVRGVEPLLADPALLAVLRAAHEAIGFDYGATHTEVRLTPSGPRIIEINGRFGGDLIPYLGWLATGVDLPLAVAALALGRPVEPTVHRNCVAAVRWLYPTYDMRLTSVEVAPEAIAPGVWEVRALAAPGQELALPPRDHVFGRLGYAIAIGPDDVSCEQALDRSFAALRATGVPLATVRP